MIGYYPYEIRNDDQEYTCYDRIKQEPLTVGPML